MADDVDDGESERKNKVCVLVWVLVLNKVQLTKQPLFVGTILMCFKDWKAVWLYLANSG